MDNLITLRKLIEKHPEWLDLPMVVYDGRSGVYDYVGASGSVYVDNDWSEEEEPEDYQEKLENGKHKIIENTVLVFSGN